jgi:hypothetical protein
MLQNQPLLSLDETEALIKTDGLQHFYGEVIATVVLYPLWYVEMKRIKDINI